MHYTNVLVVNNTTYAAKQGGGAIADGGELSLLETGAIAILNKRTLMASGNLPFSELIKDISIFVGGASSAAKPYQHHCSVPFIGYAKTAYAAGTALELSVGYDGTSGSLNSPTPAAGDAVSVVVEDTGQGEVFFHKWIANYTVKTGNDKEDTVDGIVAALNAQPNRRWTAAKVGTGETNVGFKITADSPDYHFKVSVDGIFVGATRGVLTEPVASVGTPAMLNAMWEASITEYDGKDNYVYQPDAFYNRPNPIASGTTYTVYDIKSKTRSFDFGGALNHDPLDVFSTILAIPSGATALITALDALLEAFGQPILSIDNANVEV